MSTDDNQDAADSPESAQGDAAGSEVPASSPPEAPPEASPSTEPSERCLEGSRALWLALPSVVMLALTALPSVAARGDLRLHVWIAAGASLLLVLLMSTRRPLTVVTAIRRPHYMQALTQAGVFVYWSMHWEPVSAFAAIVLLQIAFAYQIDALLAWWRGDRWSLGFGPLPVVLSINLFLWFADDYFGWQLVMVALCYVAKYVIVWERDGRRRHIFNPSSFGLAVISLGLLLTGTSDQTFGREIALTQEAAPYFIHVLFALGLIVQLQFGVVLVTASAAISTWLLGMVFFEVTGVYMFATTDIPAAVFLGMLLLVTDPATSPRGNAAKVLFGVAYGALAFASYPVLEALGSLGYYDKLLPVPLLNLLVRRFEGWGAALRPATPTSTRRNLLHVGVWVAMFAFLVGTHAVGRNHPGRDILMWQRACEDQRFRACTTYFDLLLADCQSDHGAACHNLGVELLEREQQGRAIEGRSSRTYLEQACALGIELSCGLLAGSSEAVGPPAPPDAPTDPATAMTQACESGEANACHALAAAYDEGRPGVAPDQAKAEQYYRRGCELGSVPSCSSEAALIMRAGEGADTERARAAFGKACELGDAPGCANLAGMYHFGQGVEQDDATSAQFNDKACGLGLGVACARLAGAYAKGLGVPQDMERAQQLAAQACTQGFTPACGAPAPMP